MYQEKIITPPSGYLTFVLFLALLAGGIFALVVEQFTVGAIALALNFILVLPGLIINNPNESKVLTLFGKYVGTVKTDGFFWVNPLTVKKKVSLKARNLNGHQIKVNDKLGNPIEIAAVVVWQVQETGFYNKVPACRFYKRAGFEVIMWGQQRRKNRTGHSTIW